MRKEDYDFVVSILDRWWGGPAGQRALPLFFYELGRDALVVERNEDIIGFLLGFVAEQTTPYGYIHMVGIHPDFRREGVGNTLYREFSRRAAASGATQLKAIAAVGNDSSMAFHLALGFTAAQVEGYAGPGRSRVLFSKEIDPLKSQPHEGQ